MASSPTLGLRIAAVFILFVVSALGCLTPYLFIRVSKRKERRKQREHGHHAQQEQQLEGAEQGNNGGDRQQGDKKHQHHAHLEAFQTTRAMHLLKAFSAGASAHLSVHLSIERRLHAYASIVCLVPSVQAR